MSANDSIEAAKKLVLDIFDGDAVVSPDKANVLVELSKDLNAIARSRCCWNKSLKVYTEQIEALLSIVEVKQNERTFVDELLHTWKVNVNSECGEHIQKLKAP